MNTTHTPKSSRRWWKIAAWVMGGTLTLFLLTLAGAACWLWSWQWHSGLNFHESWTAEERAALTQFERYLHTQLAEDMGLIYDAAKLTLDRSAVAAEDALDESEEDEDEVVEDEEDEDWDTESPEPSGICTRLTTAVLMKLQIAPVDAALHEIAATGKGEPAKQVSTPVGEHVTPALLAAQIGDLPALKALIAHGADPNVIMTLDGQEMESILAPLLNGVFINSRTLPWEQRRDMLDFLHSHGADLNRSQKTVPHSLGIALMAREEPQAWLWALDHGKKVSADEFGDMLEDPAAMPLVERVLAEKLVDVNDTTGKQTPLQALAAGMYRVTVEALDTGRYEERLNLLLAAGADPNLTTQTTRRKPLEILLSRTDFERSDGMPENSCCIEGPDIRTRWQMMCDKLRSAGATPPTISDKDDDEYEIDEEDVTEEDDEEYELEEEMDAENEEDTVDDDLSEV